MVRGIIMTFEGYFVYRKVKSTDIIVLVNVDHPKSDEFCEYVEINNNNYANLLLMYDNPFSVIGVIRLTNDSVKGYVVKDGVLT